MFPLLDHLIYNNDKANIFLYLNSLVIKTILTSCFEAKDYFKEDRYSIYDIIFNENDNRLNNVTNILKSFLLSRLLVNRDFINYYVQSNKAHTLVSLIKESEKDIQTTYNIFLCLWILSFEREADHIFEKVSVK